MMLRCPKCGYRPPPHPKIWPPRQVAYSFHTELADVPGLTARILNTMRNYFPTPLTTVGDVLSQSTDKLLRNPNFGKISLKVLAKALSTKS